MRIAQARVHTGWARKFCNSWSLTLEGYISGIINAISIIFSVYEHVIICSLK